MRKTVSKIMRKITRQYYFSVEGQTEKWYLKWLQDSINNSEKSECNVRLNSDVSTEPLSYIKKKANLSKINVVQFFDKESEESNHIKEFMQILDEMRLAERQGKDIKYKLAYSNFTFELWMILHKADCRSSLSSRNQYLYHINQAYNENFDNLGQYKSEKNFKRLLEKLSLDDVKQAICRAKAIRIRNKEVGYIEQQYKKFTFYKENPSISVDVYIEEVLQDCGLIERIPKSKKGR